MHHPLLQFCYNKCKNYSYNTYSSGGLFQYTEGEEVKICFVSTLSSIQAICPNRVRCCAWIISVSRGWLVWRRTSSLEMKWYHLMPRSIRRHHWWRALILRASSLVITILTLTFYANFHTHARVPANATLHLMTGSHEGRKQS